MAELDDGKLYTELTEPFRAAMEQLMKQIAGIKGRLDGLDRCDRQDAELHQEQAERMSDMETNLNAAIARTSSDYDANRRRFEVIEKPLPQLAETVRVLTEKVEVLEGASRIMDERFKEMASGSLEEITHLKEVLAKYIQSGTLEARLDALESFRDSVDRSFILQGDQNEMLENAIKEVNGKVERSLARESFPDSTTDKAAKWVDSPPLSGLTPGGTCRDLEAEKAFEDSKTWMHDKIHPPVRQGDGDPGDTEIQTDRYRQVLCAILDFADGDSSVFKDCHIDRDSRIDGELLLVLRSKTGDKITVGARDLLVLASRSV